MSSGRPRGSQRWIVLVAFCVVSCGLFGGGTDIRDFSGFDLFIYVYQPVFGYPEVGEIISAAIENTGEGEYQVTIYELAFGDAEKDSCHTWWGTDTCYVELGLGIRNLSLSERQVMLDLFKEVEVIRKKDLQCTRVSIDPHVIHHFSWDDFQVDDYVCSEPRLGKEQRDVLLGFLEALRSNYLVSMGNSRVLAEVFRAGGYSLRRAATGSIRAARRAGM